ncbi:MAG: PQQ-binding-like beta-propeller repeat protein [Prevotellaceae bacterium]|jgi:outer membrane protein assembly factor BamB|nr:PQQ-binding-like beta-propeller repeat protein [Prevotellaceae bacterium]
MKKAILRNIAIVSAIFIVAFAAMLITNYFQVQGFSPLQTEVVETLKEINDQNANNPVIQEQIRQLDLLARRAYFVNESHLMSGVYILLGMLAVFLISLRLYFAKDKDIPAKELAPVDEWIVKTQARKYVGWLSAGLAAVALVFVIMSLPYLRNEQPAEENVAQEEANYATEIVKYDTEISEQLTEKNSPAPEIVSEESPEATEEAQPIAATTESPTQPAIPTATSNALRGNNSNGISSAKNLPMKWDLANGTNIAWKQDNPRQGYNSPVINGNKVFFSGADDQARELFCLDLNTGQRLWSLQATDIPGSPAQMPKTTEDTGLAASTVATNGKQVCAVFATGDIICASTEGKRLWAKNLGLPDNHYGYASSLLIFNGMVIIQYDNQNNPRVFALDISTGEERWSKSRSEKVTWSSPMIAMVDNAPQLVLMGNPAITAYNPTNGEQLWRVECLTGEVGSSACSANGIIYGASEYSKLVAINGNDGSVLWESNEYLPEVSSPVATKENLFLATSYGVTAAFDATGKLSKAHELNTPFYSSPIIAEGKLYIIDNEGKVYIFSADNEFNLLDSFETGERTFATPAFTDGKIVVRTETSIYCVATT